MKDKHGMRDPEHGQRDQARPVLLCCRHPGTRGRGQLHAEPPAKQEGKQDEEFPLEQQADNALADQIDGAFRGLKRRRHWQRQMRQVDDADAQKGKAAQHINRRRTGHG